MIWIGEEGLFEDYKNRKLGMGILSFCVFPEIQKLKSMTISLNCLQSRILIRECRIDGINMVKPASI
jgi:hypothetical protein